MTHDRIPSSTSSAPAAAPHGNPYRQSRPASRDTIAGGTFYLANDKGSYGLKTQPVNLALCDRYLWVSEQLTIPLSAITDLGRTKHGGFIRFWDAISGAELIFNFTKLGFLRFKRKDVDAFLQTVTHHLPVERDIPTGDVDAQTEPATEISCERCNSTEMGFYVLRTFRFVGIAPLVYAYKLTPLRFVLCAHHARAEARRCCVRTALFGYLGFPGFLAAPWYVCTNLLALRRAGVSDFPTVLFCLFNCIVLPIAVISAPILILILRQT